MNASELADTIVIAAGAAYAYRVLLVILEEATLAVSKRRRLRKRRRDHDRFVAARIAAREETEARLRAEGRWDNYEIQDAMDRAGQQAAPGYRP